MIPDGLVTAVILAVEDSGVGWNEVRSPNRERRLSEIRSMCYLVISELAPCSDREIGLSLGKIRDRSTICFERHRMLDLMYYDKDMRDAYDNFKTKVRDYYVRFNNTRCCQLGSASTIL